MKTNALTIVLGLFCVTSVSAQNDIDALRYSQLTFGGTARFSSMAGSMGAIGGDISTLSFNPAGIAVFRTTEFTVTSSLSSQKSASTYNGLESGDGKLNFNLSNIGLIASWNVKENNNSGWTSFNFGFGYSRINNFNNRNSVQAANTKSSLLDTYVNNANGHASGDFDQFSTDLAWQTYLFNPLDTSGNLQYNHVIKNYGQLQKKSFESGGYMGETVLSFGGNYKEKVLVGATLGFVKLRYNEESTYEEVDDQDTIQNFKSFSYSQDLTSKGSGINFKFGFIVKPSDWLRIGAAIHTPTIINTKDTYSSSMKSDLETIKYDTVSPKGVFDYSVITPLRAIGSLGFIINKIGLLNIDYEFVDYSGAQLNSSPNVFVDVNKTIRSKYTPAQNIRIGGEVRIDPLVFRAGFALYGSPFRAGENINSDRKSYTAGIGFRENNYFIDFAYIYTKQNSFSYLYDPAGLELNSIETNNRNSSFMLTFGIKF